MESARLPAHADAGVRRVGFEKELGMRLSRIGRQDGAAAVEFAIVSVLLFMLVFGIIDFGFGLWSWNNTANAAREAARYGAVTPDASLIRDRAIAAAAGLNTSKMTVVVTCKHDPMPFTTCPPVASGWTAGDLVRVEVTYEYDFITPFTAFVPIAGKRFMLHSTSEARFEG